uniref:Uncharacterized protein n=1 Tax=Sphingomonas sp. JE1 TaxID=1628059 RepID=A0A0D4ZZ67_9SPHN|nr:hypothetical protein pJE1_027 [Sphingomonas sp. JE1]
MRHVLCEDGADCRRHDAGSDGQARYVNAVTDTHNDPSQFCWLFHPLQRLLILLCLYNNSFKVACQGQSCRR